MWRAAGLSVHPKDTEMGWPRVAMTVEYYAPLRFEDEFEVVIRIAAMTRRSIRYVCEMIKGEKRMASGSMTVVCAERRPHERARAIDIPPEVASRFEVAAEPIPEG